MDYEFEAPQYFNFENAMDEDDHDVSRYFGMFQFYILIICPII